MNAHIQRRTFLGAAASLCATGLPTLAFSQGKVELIYSDTVAESDVRATLLKEAFGGSLSADFNFKPYFGATLFK